ncbi:MAG: peptidylprolyl isomerase [Deltaproteobacteria bacterium]|nr:peptidylprolyl isomerase [Deltaproteobacteria bacterium]
MKTTRKSLNDLLPVPDGSARRALPRLPAQATVLLGTVLLGTVLLASVSGCQEATRRKSTGTSMVRAVAMVNNDPVTYEKFMSDYQLFLTNWDSFIGNNQERKAELKEVFLDMMIEDMLLDQESRRRGIRVDEAELQSRAQDLASGYLIDDKDGNRALSQNLLEQWATQLRRRMVHEKLIQAEVISNIRISASEMYRYYQRNQKEFDLPERVNVRHIAVGSRSLYNKVMRLLDEKKSFVDLVRKYSITPDQHTDGELGFVERGVLPQEFDEAIFKMRTVGSISPESSPVKTQIGYHIFRLEGYQPAGKLTYRQAIPQIKAHLLREKQTAAYREWMNGLRKKATITIDHQLLAAE